LGPNALFVFDPVKQDGMIYVSTGVGAYPNEQPGRFSSCTRFHKRITDTVCRLAITSQCQGLRTGAYCSCRLML
jgi:hypothetical protein